MAAVKRVCVCCAARRVPHEEWWVCLLSRLRLPRGMGSAGSIAGRCPTWIGMLSCSLDRWQVPSYEAWLTTASRMAAVPLWDMDTIRHVPPLPPCLFARACLPAQPPAQSPQRIPAVP